MIEYVKNIAENFPLANGGSLSAAQFLNLFLFSPEQQYTYISRLSGGEKRRLHLLTVLFRNPNFLVLDEPTNDLDLPTLSVLENFLMDFAGCLIVISHDRYFMDRLVDHLFVFEGGGVIRDFPGNYSQYREWLKAGEESFANNKGSAGQKQAHGPEPLQSQPVKRKLSYKEQREFEMLEQELVELETEKKQISEKLLTNVPFGEMQKLSERMAKISELINEKELRWLELSE